MKKVLIFSLVALIPATTYSLFNFDKEPKELEKLKEMSMKVKDYTSFNEIAAVTPLPAKFRFKLGTLLSMAIFKKQVLPYEIVEPKNYSSLENNIHAFMKHSGGQKSLKLLSYARQINAGNPYRINSFLPYFTIRSENELIGNEKVGPAAVVHELFDLRSNYEGVLNYITPTGVLKSAEVKYKEKSLPRSGNMFLFDHEVFALQELITKPEQNILQDVIIHEFTHIWHNELLTRENRNKSTVASNMTENGHDTMIVSNPTLAFSEGLAEGFEALYGTAASKILNMSKRERELFFGNFNAKLSEGMQFLANRQTYVRRNAYLYNLYDASKCTLRNIQTIDSNDVGLPANFNVEDMVARIMRGENVDIAALSKVYSWDRFQDRFYSSSGMASTTDLVKNCSVDSPARLQAKEGFIATLVYNLVASGAMIPSETLHNFDLTWSEAGKEKDWFKKFQKQSVAWENWIANPGRTPSNARAEDAEKIFLLSFRSLVEAIKGSQATTINDLLAHLLNAKSGDAEKQMRVAYQILKVTRASLLPKADGLSQRLTAYFQSPSTIARHQDEIADALRELLAKGEISSVIGKFVKVPEVYISYPSKLAGGSKRRINLNVAHHIDLIDLFGENSAHVQGLAAKLSQGPVFKDAAEALNYADQIGKREIVKAALENAATEIKEVRKLEDIGAQKIHSHF